MDNIFPADNMDLHGHPAAGAGLDSVSEEAANAGSGELDKPDASVRVELLCAVNLQKPSRTGLLTKACLAIQSNSEVEGCGAHSISTWTRTKGQPNSNTWNKGWVAVAVRQAFTSFEWRYRDMNWIFSTDPCISCTWVQTRNANLRTTFRVPSRPPGVTIVEGSVNGKDKNLSQIWMETRSCDLWSQQATHLENLLLQTEPKIWHSCWFCLKCRWVRPFAGSAVQKMAAHIGQRFSEGSMARCMHFFYKFLGSVVFRLLEEDLTTLATTRRRQADRQSGAAPVGATKWEFWLLQVGGGRDAKSYAGLSGSFQTRTHACIL